ncbi:MAG TPA: ATP-binding protein, partial [Flavobacteriales bacterium]|nr:ATP-binding protein [Flavobacteriales bacterium]
MVSGFLDWFERNKVGVIGTLTLHSLILFLLTMTKLENERDEEHRNEVRVDVMPELVAEEVVENIIRREQGLPEKVTNLTSNITAKVRPYINQQQLTEAVNNEVQAEAQAEMDRLKQERADRGEVDPTIPELDPSKWKKENYMSKPAEPVRHEGAMLVEHDLRDRVRGEAKPGYLCKDQGRIVIRVSVERADHQGVVLTVADSGPGLTAEELEIALTRFGRVRNSMTRGQEGTGLGLTIVSYLCQALGAKFQLWSLPGQGTKAMVHFPQTIIV